MKKVLFTATVDSHILHFHLPYLKMFKDNGYEVHVATNGDADIPFCDKKHIICFERSPIKFNNLRAIFKLRKIINECKFDIIHCHTPMGSVVTRLAAISARKKYGTRVIYTAHGFHFYKGASKLNWLIFYPIEKILSHFTDELICINDEDYDLACSKFNARNTHFVLGVGVDTEKFSIKMSVDEISRYRKDLGIKSDDFLIIYVAELNDNKNQKMAIEAMKELVEIDKNIKLLLVGKGTLEFEYKEQVEKYNLQNNVIFTGYRKDIPELMKISNLYISTSKREGLPVNLIEASMCLLPIIATNCRGNRDIALKENLVNIGDIRGLVNNILKLKNAHDAYSDIDVNKYSLNSIEEKMRNIYDIKSPDPIRILHVIRAMNVGGAETLIMNLYRNIDRNKIQFDFLVSRDGFFDGEINKLGGKIFKIPYLTDKGQLQYVRNLKSFFMTHREYKIIHSHIDQVSGIILKTAKKCNIPVRISHSHSISNNNGIVAKIYKNYLQKKINSSATNLFACSKEAANWLFTNRSSEAIIINNGIDIKKFEYSDKKRSKIRKELNIPDGYTIIGHIGAFRKEKNQSFLVDVFSEYIKYNPKSYLILVGDGNLKDEAWQKVDKMGLSNNIKFLGVRQDTDFIYSAFDIFCFPSIYEGLGIALLEAQVANLPAIASNNIPPIVNVSESIEFLKLDKEIWVDALKKIRLKDRQSYNKNYIEKFSKYDILEEAKNLEKMYISMEEKIDVTL